MTGDEMALPKEKEATMYPCIARSPPKDWTNGHRVGKLIPRYESLREGHNSDISNTTQCDNTKVGIRVTVLFLPLFCHHRKSGWLVVHLGGLCE